MDETYSFSPKLQRGLYTGIVVGLITVTIGFLFDADRAWANYLLNSYYFLALTLGALFFLAIQFITQSGWSALFTRIPHAIGFYLPVAAAFFLILYFGMNSVYHWSIPELRETDEIIAHKYPYLNVPFFFLRVVLFFAAWLLLATLLRKTALTTGLSENGSQFYEKSEFYSKVYIFILAITFSLATFDLIMSIDAHWFSTIFAAKNFVSGFNHAVALIALIVILLNKSGHLNELNKYHIADFSKYILILSIIWGYLWFAQYLLIWFTNIPEENIYFVTRLKGEWRVLFYSDIVLNFAIPFLILFSGKLNSNKYVLAFVSIVLLIGLWVDLFLQIMPGSVGTLHFGLIELGFYIGFLALFVFVVCSSLSRFSLIQSNHPYLNESINHWG
ncbi:MAG: hypothetical protein OEM26_06045 [Saprospiraceae bacterium]|nr:hypothetical protein [Saprospiraceae bacterium]